MPQRVFISIGSNLGPKRYNCHRAIDLIREKGAIGQRAAVTRTSSFYETPPWGGVEQENFVNAVIEVSTDLSPYGLFEMLKSIEKEMGRTEAERWGPRIIDLDIVFFGDSAVVEEGGLIIPHSRVHERAFVLVPLAEIAPEFMHPVLKKSVSELLGGIADRGAIKKLNGD